MLVFVGSHVEGVVAGGRGAGQDHHRVTAVCAGESCVAYATWSRSGRAELAVAWPDGVERVDSGGYWGPDDPLTTLALHEEHDRVSVAACSRAGVGLVATEGDDLVATEELGGRLDADPECAVYDRTGLVLALGVGRRLELLRQSSDARLASLEGHRGKVTAACFHSRDSHLVSTASEDRTFKVWDLQKRSCLFQSSVLCASPLVALALHPHTNCLAVATADGRFWVFEEDAGSYYRERRHLDIGAGRRRKARERRPHRQALEQLVIHSDDHKAEEEEYYSDDDQEEDEVPLAMRFVVGEKQRSALLVATGRSRVLMLDLVSSEIEELHQQGDDEELAGAASFASICPRGQRIAVAGAFEPVLFVGETTALPSVPPALQEEAEQGELSFFANAKAVACSPLLSAEDLRLGPAPKKLLSYEEDNKKGRKSNGDKPILFHSRIRSSGYAADIKKQRKPVARSTSLSDVEYPLDCSLLTAHQPQHDFAVGCDIAGTSENASVIAIAYSRDAKTLAVATTNGPPLLRRLPVASHRERVTIVGRRGPKVTCSLDFSHDSKTLLTAGLDGVQLWAFQDSKTCVDFPVLSLNVDTTLARFFYLDRFLAVALGGTVELHSYVASKGERSRSKRVHRFDLFESNSVTALGVVNSELSPLLIAAGSNRAIYIFDAAACRTARCIEGAHAKAAHSLALPAPSSATSAVPQHLYDVFASSSTDGGVALWDLRQHKTAARFTSHVSRREALGLALSPCMRYLATGSEDKTAYIYDLRSAKPLARLRGHSDVVSAVAFNPLFPQLATASYDAKIRFHTTASSTGPPRRRSQSSR